MENENTPRVRNDVLNSMTTRRSDGLILPGSVRPKKLTAQQRVDQALAEQEKQMADAREFFEGNYNDLKEKFDQVKALAWDLISLCEDSFSGTDEMIVVQEQSEKLMDINHKLRTVEELRATPEPKK